MKIEDVDLMLGAFVGELRLKSTGEILMCDVCGKDKAMWRHPRLDEPKPGERTTAYLCFGCGNH